MDIYGEDVEYIEYLSRNNINHDNNYYYFDNLLIGINNLKKYINYGSNHEFNKIYISMNYNADINNTANTRLQSRRRLLWTWWNSHGHHYYDWSSHTIGRYHAFTPPGWTDWSHYPYYFMYDYYHCRHHCLVHHGDEASIMSDRENNDAGHACYLAIRHRSHACWLGLERKHTNGPFEEWSDGRKVTYTKWYPGEPNNWGWGNHEDCTELYAYSHYRWNDLNCHERRGCICEQPRGILVGKYIGVTGLKTQPIAEQYCQDHYGTSLATIKSMSDNEDVMKACIAAGNIDHCWIGLKAPYNRWFDDTKAKYFENWHPGQPDNYHGHQVFYIFIYKLIYN